MASDWQGIRQVAKILKDYKESDPAKKECLNRSALSRYYYSAFHRARDWAWDQTTPQFPKEAPEDEKGKRKSTHEWLWWWIAETTGVRSFFQQGQEQGHKNRAWADYRLKDTGGKYFDQYKFEECWDKIYDLHRLLSVLDGRKWPPDEAGRKAFRSDLEAKVKEIWGDPTGDPER